mmetsp:Transcript_40913/g.107432  ORF Transcript_40913/g.107432 Transcript_40913/m.107432 type:complete len:260 (+) Transcript_40913:3-782(+)
MLGSAACAGVPGRWRERACGGGEARCEGFPEWLMEELVWKRTPHRTVCGEPACENAFDEFRAFDGNKDGLWSHGDFSAWLTQQLGGSLSPASKDDLSVQALECFMGLVSGGESSTFLTVADVSRSFQYSTCEECPDFPKPRAAMDPKTKPECSDAAPDFPVIAVADALCFSSTACLGVCSAIEAVVQVADENQDALFDDREFGIVASMTGTSAMFPGISACLLAWAECEGRGHTVLSRADAFVIATVFFGFEASDCSEC